MEKIFQNISTVKILLIRLHKHVQNNEKLILQIAGNKREYLNDWRITSFGYQRAIIFCAINDCVSLESNLNSKLYKTLVKELDENFSDEVAIEAIRNYPVYNFIVRFHSILETGANHSLVGNQYDLYKNKVNPDLDSAHTILRQWRNTIHKNGVLDLKSTLNYRYRNQDIIIYPDKIFDFKIWTLYRIAKDCTDFLLELYKFSFQDSKSLIIDNHLSNN